MTISVNVAEAKAQLSALLDKILQGEEVRICRRNVPLAVMSAFKEEQKPRHARVLGLYEGMVEISDDAFDPISDEELALWYDAPLISSPVDGEHS